MLSFARAYAARVLLLATLAPLLLAGCGDGRLGKSGYVERQNAIQEDFAQALKQASAAGESPRAHLQEVAQALDRLAARTARLKPPRDWEPEHRRMLRAMRTAADAVETMAEAPEGDVKAVTAQYARISEAEAEYRRAARAINADR